jgi:hypothetical protein
MATSERNTEIWSTRLQRELLALTTDNAPDDTKEEVVGILPPFVTVKDHQLDITKGDCVVSFLVELPAAKKSKKTEVPKEEGGGEAPDEATTTATADDDAAAADDEEEEMAPVIVTLDASLQKKTDGSVDSVAVAYPFLMPTAFLTSGSKHFPEGSTIHDGDLIDIEVDWTPSLHLSDAILNIALKIKECISQGEPLHAAEDKTKNNQDPVEDMVNRAKRLGSSFSKGLRGLASTTEKPEGEKKEKRGLRLPGRKKKKEKPKSPKANNSGEIRIGDEINMLEAPWVDCQGVYSCKAIRRPAFVDETMAVAAQNISTDKGEQVRLSSQNNNVFDEEGDGEVPGDFGNYMKLQAGGISQVCLPKRQGTRSFQNNVVSPCVPFFYRQSIIRWQMLVLLVPEPCSVRLPILLEVF